MGKKSKKFLLLTAAAIAGIYAYNKFIEETSTKKNLLKDGMSPLRVLTAYTFWILVQLIILLKY